MQDFARALADFVRDNQVWAAPIVLVLAFGESLAFVSLLVPAWGALVAIGALIGVSGISFWPVWLAGGIGAALGDWVSYKIGFKYKEHVAEMWPLSRYPGILLRGEDFVQEMGRALDLHRPFLRAAAGLGAARGRHFRDVLLAVPDRQFRLGAGLVGRPAAGRRRDGEDRRMAVAGGVRTGWNKLTTGVLAPRIRQEDLGAIFALPSRGRRRAVAEALIEFGGNRTKGTHQAGIPPSRPSSHWEDITWN